jgi:O-antigen/teichoic acid export membrane protein
MDIYLLENKGKILSMTFFKMMIKSADLSKSLQEKVFISAIWMYFFEFFNKGSIILKTVVLARLLAPEHFGIVGIATIVTTTLEVFSNIGYQKVLIQKKVIDDNHLNMAWTVSIIRGLILFLCMFLLSPLIAEFFNTPKASSVLRVMAISFVINGLNNTGTIYFSREFKFHKRAFQNSISIFLGLLVTLYLAIKLKNEWAIVFGNLFTNSAIMILSYILHPYRPKLFFDYKIFKECFAFGKWVLFSAILLYFTRQGDRIVLTKLLDVRTLGFYIIAMRFASLQKIIIDVVGRVLFAGYSKLQNDILLLRKAYLRVLNIIVFFCVPICGITVLVAKPAVLIFLGEKWIEAILPTQILTVAVLINVITNSASALFYGSGKPIYTFNMLLMRSTVLFLLIYPLTKRMKIDGVIYSYLIASLSTLPIWLIELKRLINFKFVELSNFLISIITTIFSVLVSWITIPGNSLNLLLVSLLRFLLAMTVYISINTTIHYYTKYKVIENVVFIKNCLRGLLNGDNQY